MAIDKPDLTRVWAANAPAGNIIDPDNTIPGKFGSGWLAEVPPFEHFNFIQKLQTEGLAHINEQGIPVWDANTVYPVDGLAKGSDGNIYIAVSEQSGNDPTLADITKWRIILSKEGAGSAGAIGKYAYTQMGVAFESLDPLAPVNQPFASWVHATVDYDSTTDNFVVFYNISPGHNISRNSVLLMLKDAETPTFETPLLVASDEGNFSYKTQAAGITPGGDYLALVGVFNWGNSTPIRTDIYRSNDKGLTWSVTTMQDETSANIIAYNGDVSGFLKLASGRILTFAVEPAPSYLSRIYYSDDDGATWTKATIAGNPTDVTEPGWVELPNGTIICMARASVRNGSVNEIIPAKFMTSSDGGVNWTVPVDSASITDFTLSNGEMLINENEATVEFIHHSRHTKADDFSTLYVSSATYENAEADNFGPQVKIGRLAAYTALGNSTGDSGYVGAAKSSKGTINVFYYNGERDEAQINWAIGRQRAAMEREYFIDPNRGDKLTGGGSGAYKTQIYSGKLESYKPLAPVGYGYLEGTGVFRKNEGSLAFSLNDQGRAGAAFLGGIDLTNVNTLNVSYDNIAIASTADFGIYLFNKAKPTSATDGRVDFEVSAVLGMGVISLDVSGLTGLYYPQLMLSNNSGSGGPSEARAYEFWLEGSILLGPLPSEPGIDHSVYFRGNENPYLSNGWETGYAQNAPAAGFNEDRMVLTADGSAGASIQSVKTGLVDLTGRTMVEAIVDVDITNPTASDFGIAIFNKAAPTASNDGRVLFNYTKLEGVYKATLDISGLTPGSYYVFIVANANTNEAAAGITTASILDVRFY